MKVHGELDGFPLGFMVKPFHFMEEMKRYYAYKHSKIESRVTNLLKSKCSLWPLPEGGVAAKS